MRKGMAGTPSGHAGNNVCDAVKTALDARARRYLWVVIVAWCPDWRIIFLA